MNKKTIILGGSTALLLLALGVYTLTSLIVTKRLQNEVADATADLALQQQRLIQFSDRLRNGGADPVTESIIADCTERNKFDELLSNLSAGMQRSDLLELSQLFDRCGSFYALRKAMAVARLEREVEYLEELIDRLERLDTNATTASYTAPAWKELVRIEKEQSGYFTELVSLQGKIIYALYSGKTVASPEVTDLLKQIEEVQQMQVYNVAKMNEIRNTLVVPK